jgi:hypothetical protein
VNAVSSGKKKHLRQTISPTLTNEFYNLRYTGSLWMGFDLQEVPDVIFDTGSAWLALKTTDCPLCTNAVYDPASSPDTYREMNTRDAEMDITYLDSTYLEGIQVFDWMCITDDADTCLTDFKWMNVQVSGLSTSVQGVLGMCADVDAIDYGVVTPEPTGSSFIEQLFNSGVIQEKMFAFGLREMTNSADSFLDIGFWDENALKDPS